MGKIVNEINPNDILLHVWISALSNGHQRGCVLQFMGADTEIDSQALVRIREPCRRWRGRISGLRGVKDISRMWSTGSTKQGS